MIVVQRYALPLPRWREAEQTASLCLVDVVFRRHKLLPRLQRNQISNRSQDLYRDKRTLTSGGLVPSTYGSGFRWNFFCNVSVKRTASLALLISCEPEDQHKSHRLKPSHSREYRSRRRLVERRNPGH